MDFSKDTLAHKNKFTVIVFAAFALALIAFVIVDTARRKKTVHETPVATTVVTPTEIPPQIITGEDVIGSGSNVALNSLIPLEAGEVLLQTLTCDFNGDGYSDQINAVRKNSRSTIVLIIGIYNARRNVCVRTEEITTVITQVRTFSYSVMDITGEHTNSIIYSGVAPNGDTVMQIFNSSGDENRFVLNKIGDFRSDGTIFIQQLDRYDSYASLQTDGPSFPVTVYSSDSDDKNSPDQIQTVYDWSSGRQRYVQTGQVRVAGRRLADAELSRIQDGTVSGFTSFLDGLWYRADGQDSQRYLFFAYPDREITFFADGSAENFIWKSNNLRRSEIYISAVNESIANLTRRMDVSILGLDTVSVHVNDEVRMMIHEDNLWNGTYKKLPSRSPPSALRMTVRHDNFVDDLKNMKEWQITAANSEFEQKSITASFTETNYNVSVSLLQYDTGRLYFDYIFDEPVIEFRSEQKNAFFEKSYTITKQSDNSFSFEPVVLSPAGLLKGSGKTLVVKSALD
ncbi:MAG: hypothetical protein Ta2A_01690 [Treponemataceae bacterium]|nr:MAG: hypothetical protein Ta2A_01690 [Treponemataceae bacterium]